MKAKVHFFKCLQDSHDLGRNVDHMVSRVYFRLDIDVAMYPNVWANIRQAYGGNFKEDPIEVNRPHGYEGPFNYAAFQQAAEQYYRLIVGSTASVINIQGGSDIGMHNNSFDVDHEVEFLIDENSPAW